MSRPSEFIFIINPISGMQKGKGLVDKIESKFSGYSYQIIFTEHRGHGGEIAREYLDKNVCLVTVGGDGSVNEIASQILNSTCVSLGIIPMGSGNGLARSLGIPLDEGRALELLKEGKLVSIDTCSFNDIPFFCTAGIAFDALVAKDFDEAPNRGLRTYFQASFRQFKKYSGVQIKAKINNETLDDELFMMAFANAQQYGYGAKINPISSLTDGILEVAVIKKMNLLRFGEFTSRLFLGSIQKFNLAKIYQTKKEIELSSTSRLAHLDGEPLEFDGRAVIKLLPKSLRLIT